MQELNSAAHLVGFFAALLVQFYQLVLARAGLDAKVEAETGLDQIRLDYISPTK